MKNTDFMNLSLPEGADKIDIEILNSDFTAIENLLKQHAIIETMTLNGEGVIIGAIGPYIRLQNIDTVQVSIDIGKETYTLASGENVIIRETAENIGIITSGNVHITYFVNPKTYADKEFYTKKKVDELLSKVEGNVEVDAELSETSENPVQNKAITAKFKEYYNSEKVNELIDGIGTPEDVYTKTETDNLLSTKANKNNTYTKTETDNKITEKVSEIVSGAPEDFDTLKEMSDWLTEHEDSAASMNSAIQKNADDIATANTAIQKNKTDISTANTNIQKNINDITAVKNSVAINKSTLGIQCKNLLKPVTISQGETKGITITVNDDGTITATGTATETFVINVGSVKLVAGNYILSGCPSGGSNTTYRLDTFYDAASRHRDLGNSVKVNLSSDTNVVVRLVIYPAAGEVNLTFAPMIRDANIVDDSFEIYKQNLQEQIKSHEVETKSQDAIIKTTLGTQTKNLLPYKIEPTVQSGITVTIDEDDIIHFSGTTTSGFTRQIQFSTPLIFDYDVIIAGATKLVNLNYIARLLHTNGETTYSQIGTKGLTVTAGTQIVYIYFQMTTKNLTIDAEVRPIIVHADVKDLSYEPYKPSLQEQINTLLARIEALETATTEGGE